MPHYDSIGRRIGPPVLPPPPPEVTPAKTHTVEVSAGWTMLPELPRGRRVVFRVEGSACVKISVPDPNVPLTPEHSARYGGRCVVERDPWDIPQWAGTPMMASVWPMRAGGRATLRIDVYW